MGAVEHAEDEKRLSSKLCELSGRKRPIQLDDDVVYEIGLNGDDLHELLAWLHAEYGIDFSGVTSNDLPMDEPPEALKTLFGKRRFKSMTVRGLLVAMQTKQWTFP
jgi:hypothetical protein